MAFSLENDFMLYAAPAGVRAGQKIYQRIGNFLLRRAVERHAPLQKSLEQFFPVNYTNHTNQSQEAFSDLRQFFAVSDQQVTAAKKVQDIPLPEIPKDLALRPELLAGYIDALFESIDYDLLKETLKMLTIPVGDFNTPKIAVETYLEEMLKRVFKDYDIKNLSSVDPKIKAEVIKFFDDLGLIDPLQHALEKAAEHIPDLLMEIGVEVVADLKFAGVMSLGRSVKRGYATYKSGYASFWKSFSLAAGRFTFGTVGAKAGALLLNPVTAGMGANGLSRLFDRGVKYFTERAQGKYKVALAHGKSRLDVSYAQIPANMNAAAKSGFDKYTSIVRARPDIRTNQNLTIPVLRLLDAYVADCNDAISAIQKEKEHAISQIDGNRKLHHKLFGVRWAPHLERIFNEVAERKVAPWQEFANAIQSDQARTPEKLSRLLACMFNAPIVAGGHVERLSEQFPDVVPIVVQDHNQQVERWSTRCVDSWSASVEGTNKAMQSGFAAYTTLSTQVNAGLKVHEDKIKGYLVFLGADVEPKVA